MPILGPAVDRHCRPRQPLEIGSPFPPKVPPDPPSRPQKAEAGTHSGWDGGAREAVGGVGNADFATSARSALPISTTPSKSGLPTPPAVPADPPSRPPKAEAGIHSGWDGGAREAVKDLQP